MVDAHLTLEVYPEGEGQNQLNVWAHIECLQGILTKLYDST